MRRGRFLLALGLAAGLAAGAGAVAWRGQPVAATARLVSLPLGISAPDLDDPARVSRGARHYAQVCAGCHAHPGAPRRTVGRALRPPAPVLHLRIGTWPDELLFVTVRDGVPNSGMPAWPAPAREDEVWDVVAFLRRLPGLDPSAYAALTGEEDVTGILGPSRGCVRCHGAEGEGRDGIPRLDIQSPEYLADALRAFRHGERASGVMQIATQGLDDGTLDRLAAEFGRETRVARSQREDAPPALIVAGVPDRKVPPCAACHGTSVPVRADFPALTGQDRRYLVRQLRLFAGDPDIRGGGPFRELMEIAGHNLSPQDVEDVAEWYGASE